ncbi:MAG: PocR ligand-binding domain-containing protein [Bacillota bacterium]|nr:PocR ligand-binding domain-containing protein [Bacillota bacterium]
MNNHDFHWLDTSPEKEFLEKTLQSFSTISGLKALLVDKEGRAVVSTENQIPDCRFCQIIKNSPLGREKCQRSYARAGREAAKYGEPYVFRCHAGLVAWAVPIIINKHQGAVICGQVLMWEPEDYFLDEIGSMVKGLDVDISEVKMAALNLNVLSSDKVQAVTDLLFVIANQIMNKESTFFAEQKSIAAYQAVLSEEIAEAKHNPKARLNKNMRETVDGLSLQGKERELMAKVRSGEKDSAEKLLDSILVSILNHNTGNIGDVKARIIELLVMLSRAAVDGGMDSKEIRTLNSKFYEELYAKETTEEVCYWTKNMVRIFSEEVKKSKGPENLQAVYAAADYIQDHFKEKISIASIAQEVHLSSSYLSHIFSQTFGYTITDYITYVRLEHAKSILSKGSTTISEAALDSGFEDISYFSRVFKKVEGISPREYKKRQLP